MELFAHPGSTVCQSPSLHPDGSLRSTIASKSTFANVDASVGGLIRVIPDVSSLKRTEEALRESELRLSQITNCLPETTLASAAGSG